MSERDREGEKRVGAREGERQTDKTDRQRWRRDGTEGEREICVFVREVK